jgi:hypothetical protein
VTPETTNESTVSDRTTAALGQVTTFCGSLPQPLLDFKACQGDRTFQVPVIRWECTPRRGAITNEFSSRPVRREVKGVGEAGLSELMKFGIRKAHALGGFILARKVGVEHCRVVSG